MYKLYLPHISTSARKPVFGVVVCGGHVPEGANYNYTSSECEDDTEYFPMVFDSRSRYGKPGPKCAGKTLLLGNEPEFPQQGNDTPAQGAALLYEYRNWSGPLYGFGTQHFDRGWEWFQSMMTAYQNMYNEPLPLDGIHMHTYAWDILHPTELTRWRDLADDNGWKIIVSEIGLYPYKAKSTMQIAEALPAILDVAIKFLKPTHVFWFTLALKEPVYPDEFSWHRTALRDKFGETVVGEAWSRYTGWRYQL